MIKIKRLFIDSYQLYIYLLILFFWANTQTLSKLLVCLAFFGITRYISIKSYPKIDKYTVLSILFFLILFIGYLYGTAKFEFSYLDKSLSFITLPLILHPRILTKKNKQKIFNFFFYSTTLFAFICLLNVLLCYLSIGSFYISDGQFLHPIFIYTRLNPLSHPIYTSLFVNIVLVITIKYQSKNSWIKSVIIILLITFCFFIASRLGLLVSIGLGIYFLIKEYKLKALFFIIGVFLILFIYTEINVNSSTILKRYTKSISQVTQGFKTNNSISQRMQLYYLSLYSIKDLPLFGYGARSTGTVLKETYKEYFETSFEFYVTGKNAHNQYLDLILSRGLLGVIAIVTLIYLLILSFRNYQEITLIILFYLLFESMLARFHGVLIISFITRFFFLRN